MSNQMPTEFCTRQEVLPAITVGLALNLFGRYFVATRFNIPTAWPDMPLSSFLFADLSGTALVAILLGPWWAATVGVLASCIDGLQYTVYFPFGTTSVIAGLAWGYLARLPRIRRGLSFGVSPAAIRNTVYSYSMMVLGGSVACAAMSAITKVVLYTKMGLPLTLNNSYYIDALNLAQTLRLPHADIMSMLGADLLREFADKSLVVALAMIVVSLFGFIPSDAEHFYDIPLSGRQGRERLKSDAFSILVFAVVYAIFLLIARLGKPVIAYKNAPTPVYWLQDHLVLFLLYIPIILAVAAFLLASYDASSSLGQLLDADRRLRLSLYRQLYLGWSREWLEKIHWMRAIRQESTFGLLGMVLLWFQHKQFSGSFTAVLLYFGGCFVFAILFFEDRRSFSLRWKRARRWVKHVRQWLQLEHSIAGVRQMVASLGEILGGELLVIAERPSQHGSIMYSPCILVSQNPAIREFVHRIGSDRALIVAPLGDGNITPEVCGDIQRVMDSSNTALLIVLTTAPDIVEAHVREWIASLHNAHKDAILLGHDDILRAITISAQKLDTAAALLQGRLRLAAELAHYDADGNGKTAWDLEILSGRALKGVQFAVSQLALPSTVFDLGAGRGRHSLFAAERGHRVLYVERRDELKASLDEYLKLNSTLNIETMCSDIYELDYRALGQADLVILAGVLQHARRREDVAHLLDRISTSLIRPNSHCYIEMLLDMSFDGAPPGDGRYPWAREEFEAMLGEVFAAPQWQIQRVRGPYARVQNFTGGARSFSPPASVIKCTSIEYLITHSYGLETTAPVQPKLAAQAVAK